MMQPENLMGRDLERQFISFQPNFSFLLFLSTTKKYLNFDTMVSEVNLSQAICRTSMYRLHLYKYKQLIQRDSCIGFLLKRKKSPLGFLTNLQWEPKSTQGNGF